MKRLVSILVLAMSGVMFGQGILAGNYRKLFTPASTFIQGNVGHVSLTGSPSVGVAFISNNVATHAIVVDVAVAEGFNGCGTISTPTDTRSNIYVAALSPTYTNGGTSNYHIGQWVAYNVAAGANTVTVADTCGVSSTSITVAIHEYGPILTAAALDATSGLVSNNTGSPATVSLTTTVSGDTLHMFSINAGGSGTPVISQSGGYVSRESFLTTGSTFGPPSIETWDLVAGAPGVYANTSSSTIGPQNVALLIALKP